MCVDVVGGVCMHVLVSVCVSMYHIPIVIFYCYHLKHLLRAQDLDLLQAI